MADDRSAGAQFVRIDDLRRCLATAFERLELTAEDARGWLGSWSIPSSVAIPTTASRRSTSLLATTGTAR
jgi:hypothetical protein